MHIQKLAMDAVSREHYGMKKVLIRNLKPIRTSGNGYGSKDSSSIPADRGLRETKLFDWSGIISRKMTRLDILWHYYKMLNAAVLKTNPWNGYVNLDNVIA